MSGRFWEFQQLTDSLKGISHFDHIPKAGKLYIGGLSALYKEPDPLQEAGITHVLTVLDFDVRDAKQLENYHRLMIRVEDTAEDDLLKHFPDVCGFIDAGLDSGGGVFVHCAMGVSRSATVVMAYLIWKLPGMTMKGAWDKVKESRARVRPNVGFVKQLKVWERMCRQKGGWDEEMYGRWKREGWDGGNVEGKKGKL